MRRGRIIAAAAVIVAMLAVAAAGMAATPQKLFTHNAVQQGYGQVGGVQTGTQKHSVAGANHVQRRAGGNAPASRAIGGTLPFTGSQLGIFVLIGAALLGGGLLVRRFGARRGEL